MNEQPRAGRSIDPEMLAAYIDKRLTPEQRAAVEAQLAADPESYELLVESMKALDAIEDQPAPIPMPVKKRTTWIIAASALAAAAVIALVVWTQPDLLRRLRGGSDPRIERLVASVGERRYVEGRLTGGFEFGPLLTASRGSELSEQNLALLAAAGELQRHAQEDASAENLNAWGSAQLLLRDVDGAVVTLRSAL